ncbi:energy transducer TonB [Marinicella sp. S1101]|uniref:energy transducer TonB n=1 Tax=Marinicella marina TaxID=2996016 RepID=UPI002260D5A3|nr:energy transducer TonB [Marinicella marina]MCX7554929.1 energy transducer TonB [Marinicella marina]MDJ1141247.1 energy transducer TonB [Marinicella marina]
MSKICLLLFLLIQPFFSTAKEPEVHEIIPIVQIAPQYPRVALMARIEGEVSVVMSINAQGSVDSVEVAEAQPPRIFNDAAINAGMKFKFKPKVIDGKGVPSLAKITFVFELPEQPADVHVEAVFELLKPKLNEIKVQPKMVVLADSVQIKSTIRPKKVSEVHVMFEDDLLELKPQPLIWGGVDTAEELVPDFAEQLALRKAMVEQQYAELPGMYQRFHRIYHAKSHPPVLINAVDSVDFTHMGNGFPEEYRLTIDEQGDVIKWRALHNKVINKAPAMVELVDEFMATLKFLPALKKHQAVKSKITIGFNTVLATEFDVHQFAQKNNRQHVAEQPWVKLAAIINPDGTVHAVKVLDSSEQSFEAMAVEGLKGQLFGKTKVKWQMQELVEFAPKN